MDLQRASGWKRMAAWLLDIMLVCMLAVGAGVGFSAIFDFDTYDQQWQSACDLYQTRYNTTFDISQADYEKLTAAEKADYDAAYDALLEDAEAMHAFNMIVSISLLITSLGIFVSMLVLEFVVPLILKNGQTLGKKCFSLGVTRVDGVQINSLQLFARTVLGKYTIGTMIPVYIVQMLYWGAIDMTGTIILLALLVAQIVCVAKGSTRSAIHDRLAGTVVVDINSQKIFASTDDLIAYTQRIHAEEAKRQEY